MAAANIEKKLSDLSAEYIYTEGTGNILLLAMSATERLSGDEKKPPFDIPEELISIREKIDDYFIRLEDILNNEEERLAAFNDVLALNHKLIELYKIIYDYYSEWNTLSFPLGDETAIRKYKEKNYINKKLEYDVFYTDCVNFLTGSEDIHQLREYTSQLLKCMPMRMARGRFFDIVLRSLRAAFDGESEDCITKSLEAFKRGCAPSLSEDYGKIFPEIAEWLASKKEINPARLDDETLYSEYEDFGIMLDSINDVEDYITSIYNELSSLIIVFYLTFTFDELTEKSIVYSDLYHTVVDMMTGEISKEEAEPMYETLLDQLGEAFEPLIDKVNDINERETKLIEKIHDTSKLSEDTLKSISAEGFIRGVYYTTLDDVIFNFDIDENSPVASKEFSEKAFADFIEYIQEYYKTLQPYVRKANMLTLLGAIPVSMDIPDTIDYVKSSIAACIDEEQKMRIVDNVGRVFTSNGFKYTGEDNEDDDECDCHDHHHHDHDCGCHDHHHDHDCDCHDHDCDCHDHHHDHDCDCHDHDCDCHDHSH